MPDSTRYFGGDDGEEYSSGKHLKNIFRRPNIAASKASQAKQTILGLSYWHLVNLNKTRTRSCSFIGTVAALPKLCKDQGPAQRPYLLSARVSPHLDCRRPACVSDGKDI